MTTVPGRATGHHAMLTQHRFTPVEALPWLIAIACFFLFPDYLTLGSQVLIMILFAISLDLILGYAGIVSLGHAAFFGTGAYVAGILSAHLGWHEPLTGLLMGGLAAAVVGVISGWLILRTSGLALLMLTLATTILLQELANEREDITGGADGLSGLQLHPLLGRFDFDIWGQTAYIYALVILFLMFLLARRIVNSPFGYSLRGIRENPLRMPAIGAPVRGERLQIYTISAFMAGVAGALLAQTTQFVSLDTLSFIRSGDVLIILIIGGTGRLYGAFAGAAIYMVLQDQFSKQSPEYWLFGLGLVLLATVLFAPRGLLGLCDDVAAKFRRKPTA